MIRLPVLAVLALLAFGCSPSDANPGANSGAQTNAERVRDALHAKQCVNVANALNAPVEGEWGYTINQNDLALIRAAGFDSVRVPINFHAHTTDTPPYTISETYLRRIDEVIAWSLDADLAIVVDMHQYGPIMTDPEGHIDRLIAMWDQIARRYKDMPEQVYFELLNEPRDALNATIWNRLAADLVRTIRRSNPDRILFVGGPAWNTTWGLRDFTPPKDKNIVVPVHIYDPLDFTHQGAEWDVVQRPSGVVWGTDEERADLKQRIDQAAAWGRKHDLHMQMNEFGVYRAAEVGERAEWTAAVMDSVREHGWTWCYFDFIAGFEVYDGPNQRWIPEIMDALGLEPQSEGQPNPPIPTTRP